jgi:hypothetical protein
MPADARRLHNRADELTPEHKANLKQKLQTRRDALEAAMNAVERALESLGKSRDERGRKKYGSGIKAKKKVQRTLRRRR